MRSIIFLVVVIFVCHSIGKVKGSMSQVTLHSCDDQNGPLVNVTFSGSEPSHVHFRLKNGKFSCSSERSSSIRTNVIYNNNSNEDGIFQEAWDQENYVIDRFGIFPNGSLHSPFHMSDVNQYCVRKLTNDNNEGDSIFEECCTEKEPCVQKCCSFGEDFTFAVNHTGCNMSGETTPWTPIVYDEYGRRIVKNHSIRLIQRTLPENCQIGIFSSSLRKLKYPLNPFKILETGDVMYYSNNVWERKNASIRYCVDRLQLPPDLQDSQCPGRMEVLVLCFAETQMTDHGFMNNSNSNRTHVHSHKENVQWINVVYLFCLITAMLFLLTTAIVHFLLWEKQNIHAWSLQCYVLSLFFFYLFLVIIYADSFSTQRMEKGWCVFVGIATHFFGLCAFSWLSIINFDLWWTFRVLKPMGERNLDIKRFLWYTLGAFSIPCLIVGISIGLHYHHQSNPLGCSATSDLQEDPIQYPEYGEKKCYLSNEAIGVYFYWPLAVFLLSNLLFYITTTWRMYSLYRTTRRASETTASRQKQSYGFRLFLKLFLVMGITWTFELINWLVDKSESKWYWVILDMANIFQALAIFVIFVCKRDTRRSLEQKFPSFRRVIRPIARFTRAPTYKVERSTEGSTKISRAEISKSGISEVTQQRFENVELNFVTQNNQNAAS